VIDKFEPTGKYIGQIVGNDDGEELSVKVVDRVWMGMQTKRGTWSAP
jgi:hypothetical protein